MATKHCEASIVLKFLLKQISFTDSFYRNRALDHIKEIGGVSYRDIFIQIVKNEIDEEVVQCALRNLTDLFRGNRDLEILQIAYNIYVKDGISASLKLSAIAAMMYQLNIPHDKDGRPAWWDEDEDVNHPALQRAVAETKELLQR